jgi:PAS domain S-box-containing protein
VLDALPDAVTVQSQRGLVYANRESLRILGFDTVEDLVATPLEELVERYEAYDAFGDALDPAQLPGRRVLRGESHAEELVRNVVRATGEESWRLVLARPLETPEGRLAINVVRDVTDLKHVEGGLRLLVDVSAALASSLDVQETLAAVGRVLVPALADAYAVEVGDDVFIHPAQSELGARLRAARQDGHIPGKVVQTTHLDAPAVPGLEGGGLVVVPLAAADDVLGSLVLVTAPGRRRLGAAELTLAELVGKRVAAALERARLFAAADEAQRRLRFAAEASGFLSGSIQFEETLARLVRLAIPDLADWCLVDVLEPGGRLDRVAAAAADPVKQELLDELRRDYAPLLGSPQPAAAALRTGATTLFPSLDAEALRATVVDERHLAIMEELAPRTAIAVPLVAHGETVGALTLAFAESDRSYDAEVRARAEELAGRAALAVANARLYRGAQDAQSRLSLLARASDALSSSLAYEETLTAVAELAVPEFADWCVVDVLDDGELERIALVHRDPEKRSVTEELRRRYPTGDRGSARVVQTGESELSVLTDDVLVASAADEGELELLRALGLGSRMCVPMVARGVTLGALCFVNGSSRAYTEDDLALAEELGRRAAVAVDNARLYQQAEERGDAARALAYVGDGVFLVDRQGAIRLWNPAAEAITGLAARDVIHRPAAAAIPGWETIALRIPVGSAPGAGTRRPETVPVELDGRELWLSIAGVSYPGGTVYAFRNLTEEHRIERLKSDFVSTISHELRTPLAAIYGAALTLRRSDIVLGGDQRGGLLDVIATESDRLARIVHDVLYASRIETGSLDVTIESADAEQLARATVDAARAHKPPGIEIKLAAPKDLPRVAADPDKVSQVLSNLLENAVKYSPDGGEVELRLEPVGRSMRFSVRDEGIGIPRNEQERIFEKFYRLDPDLTRGVGGTGLGLYICREVIRRMGGRIWVQSRDGNGSTFLFELPLA